MAASRPATRLVSCQSESCLLVSGHRDDPAAIVRINGHAVPVEGKRDWRARLPLSAVRQWSAPYARTIEISVPGAQTSADLPIGLLGHVTDLSSLDVR
jgi:hypothetical protein